MSDEPKVRHIIVTLYDAWAEEADTVAASIDRQLARWSIEGSARVEREAEQ